MVEIIESNNVEGWEIDGFPLSTEAWNIATFGGSRYSLPPLRGDDQEFAYAPGKEHHAKYADSRTISLVMWTAGKNADGTFTNDQIVRFNDNYQRLRRLVYKPFGGEVTLTRRWRLTNPVTELVETQVATAKAQIAGTMDLSMTGRTRADFSIDMLLSNPYFYLPEVTVEIPYNTPTIVHNPGDDVVGYKDFTVAFNGPESGTALTNPKLTNETTNPDTWFRFSRAIPDVPHNILAPTITFDIEDYQITPKFLPLSFVTHSGSRRWFTLLPGDNTVTLTSDGGTGTATLTFRPPVV